MLFTLSLASKLGIKHNLQAFSLHPGVIWTNLGNHIDWDTEFEDLRMFPFCQYHYQATTNMIIGNADKTLGNAEGWREFNPKTLERGVATHIYAAFDPSIKGTLTPSLLILSIKLIVEERIMVAICSTAMWQTR